MTRTVLHYIDTSEFAGAERAMLTLMTGLDRSRWRPILFHPDAPGLRPTPDRVRETLFNWLGQRLDGNLHRTSGQMGMIGRRCRRDLRFGWNLGKGLAHLFGVHAACIWPATWTD